MRGNLGPFSSQSLKKTKQKYLACGSCLQARDVVESLGSIPSRSLEMLNGLSYPHCAAGGSSRPRDPFVPFLLPTLLTEGTQSCSLSGAKHCVCRFFSAPSFAVIGGVLSHGTR